MPDQKITDLSAAGALTGTELVEVVQSGSNVKTTTQHIANLGGGGGGHVIEEEGTPLTQRTKLNFVGAGVTVTDDSGDDASVVTIPSAAAILATSISNGDTTHAPDGNSVFDALALKDNLPVRADVTLANGVVTIDWSAGDIQNLTISEVKVITTISNPVVGKTIILIIPGTNSLTFSGLTAVIEGTYNAGVENRIYIQCLKVSGGAEYRITYDSNLSPFPFSALTSSSNVTTWAVSAQEWFSKRTLTLTENSTFSMSGLLNGYQGEVWVTASGGARVVSIPSGTTNKMMGVGDTTAKNISIPSAGVYVIWWSYDGTTTRWGYIEGDA